MQGFARPDQFLGIPVFETMWEESRVEQGDFRVQDSRLVGSEGEQGCGS